MPIGTHYSQRIETRVIRRTHVVQICHEAAAQTFKAALASVPDGARLTGLESPDEDHWTDYMARLIFTEETAEGV